LRQTTAGIVAGVLAALRDGASIVVVAYPLNRVSWFYVCRRLRDAGVASAVISLRASYAAIVDAGRRRHFSDAERQRIQVMLAEGYAERPFSDLIFDTDKSDFETTATDLVAAIRTLQLSMAAPGLAPHSAQEPS
jgi:hypothetical protein